MFAWTQGRQNTGYKKLKLFQFLNMDCYILKYVEGDFIPPHTDPVPGRKHFRLNIILKNAEKGGELLFKYPGHYFSEEQTHRVQFFRSDLVEHSVSKIEKGTRYVLTFGVAI